MEVVSFPCEQCVAIESPRDISAVESLLAAVAAFVDATGGAAELEGRDLGDTPLRTRVRLLGEMYAVGRVALDWRDGRDGRAYAAALEKRHSPRTGARWRVDVRTTDGETPALVDALSAPDIDDLACALLRALADGFSNRRRATGARVAQFGR